MPSWRVHVFIGISLTILLTYVCHSFKLWYLFIFEDQVQYLFWMHCIFVCMLASVLPDFDYRRTRIRYALGPMLGLFIIISYIYLNYIEPLKIDLNLILILMVGFLVIPFLAGLVFPFKHHGKLHSISAACIYFLIWVGVELLIFKMSPTAAGIIGLFGFAGYCSHLLLDLDLKFL